ncbi:hypothetical protein SKAU_G00173980, partial [Synaphobranchus kaupii]
MLAQLAASLLGGAVLQPTAMTHSVMVLSFLLRWCCRRLLILKWQQNCRSVDWNAEFNDTPFFIWNVELITKGGFVFEFIYFIFFCLFKKTFSVCHFKEVAQLLTSICPSVNWCKMVLLKNFS